MRNGGNEPEDGRPVRRRAAFYLPGYDPRRPRVYHALFAEELAAAAALRGFAAHAGALEGEDGPTPAFAIAALDPAGEWETRTTLTILRWDDLARPAFRAPLAPRLGKLLRVGADLVRRGVVARLARIDRQFAAFIVYPYAATLLLALLVVAAAGGAGVLGWRIHPLAAPAAALAAGGLAGWLALRLDRPLFLRYLLEDWLFSFAHERGETDVLQERLEVFAEAVVAAARDPGIDEVLLVGHSSGAFLAPETLALALARDPDLGRRGPAVSLLTLGTVAPLMLVDETCVRYRAAVGRLANEPSIVWHEVQSRHDAMNVCPVDPAALSGRFPERTRWPRTLRLSMPQLVAPGRLGLFRERLFFFRTHFRFLRANERVHWYDFYGILAGPKTLAARHAEVPDMRDAGR
ncbi:hypothetical protein [Salinarimonas rosea]|uniref:hypothetical protein n=1 Tax=Salinarimonas rosea TaxID=552063 RepID=UPI00042250AD|nr:hypothetical protein [Salinarimonas rosea]